MAVTQIARARRRAAAREPRPSTAVAEQLHAAVVSENGTATSGSISTLVNILLRMGRPSVNVWETIKVLQPREHALQIGVREGRGGRWTPRMLELRRRHQR